MRVLATSSLPGEFAAFCAAVRTWLRDAECLDPSLAAVADQLERISPGTEESTEARLAHIAADATDVHAVLGASALLSLWSGLPR